MKAICEKLPKTLLVIGPSGSGKDTQVDKLVERCGCVKITTGEMFRDSYEKKTAKGIQAYEVWSQGEWVADDLTYEMLSDYVTQFDREKPWILVAVVRRPTQVPMLDALLEKQGRSLGGVLYFPLSEEAAIERMSLRRICPKCKADYHLKYKKPKNGEVCDNDGEQLTVRDDDRPDAIANRLRSYNETIRPILEEYRKRGILIEVDAAPPIEEVWKSVQKAFDLSE